MSFIKNGDYIHTYEMPSGSEILVVQVKCYEPQGAEVEAFCMKSFEAYYVGIVNIVDLSVSPIRTYEEYLAIARNWKKNNIPKMYKMNLHAACRHLIPVKKRWKKNRGE